MVTHLTTNPPVRCLCMAERTGSPICHRPMVVCEREGENIGLDRTSLSQPPAHLDSNTRASKASFGF